jgi:hypothetical protein
MHRKTIFALAGVFLIVALVVPPVLLIMESDHDLDNYINSQQNPNGLQTNGNITITDERNENFQAYSYAAIIEVVFVVLFAITLFYGINHTHPKH